MKNIFLCFLILAMGCKVKHTSMVGNNTLSHKSSEAIANAESEIRRVFIDQQEAWNRADIKGFMQGYWNNEQLSFIGSKGLTRGWKPTMENYLKSYPDAATMGKLTFDILELRPLSTEAFYMIGKYTLKRTEDEPSGYFNVIWEKKDGNWVITSDHSS